MASEVFPLSVQLRVKWSGTEDMPVLTANHVLVQVDPNNAGQPDLVFLTIGQASPPVAIGTPQEQEAAMKEIGEVVVHTLGRYSMTPARAMELLAVLEKLRDALSLSTSPTVDITAETES